MEDKTKKLQFLIDEFRKRVDQLESYRDEDYLVGVLKITDWLFMVRDFKPAFDYLEELNLWQFTVLNELGEKLFSEIRKTWEAIEKYVTPDFLSRLSKEHFIETKLGDKISSSLKLERMIKGEEKFYVIDIYHELRFLVEQLYYAYGEKLNKLVILSKDNKKEIREFVPTPVFEAFLSFNKISEWIKFQKFYSPLETLDYLKQLLILRGEEDWQWQFKKWKEVFGRNFYTPRMYAFSNFLFDFLILGIKKKKNINFGRLERLSIAENLKFKWKENKNGKYNLLVGENGEYGFVEFDPAKSSSLSGEFVVGKVIELLLNDEKREINFGKLKSEIKDFSLNNIYTYLTYLNERFKKAVKDGKMKLYLIIVKKEGKKNSENKLKLLAFPFSQVFSKKESLPEL